MSMKLCFYTILILSIGIVYSEQMYESFEEGIPEHWRLAGDGLIKLSDRHLKHGTNALRWQWKAGDEISVKHSLGDIYRQGGYAGTYSKASIVIWLYNETPDSRHIRFEFCENNEVKAFFLFPLNFKGWRPVHYKLSYKSELKGGRITPATDTINILAPEGEGASDSVYFDLLVYNCLYRYTWPQGPMHDPPWQPFQADSQKFQEITTVTQTQREGIKKIYSEIVAQILEKIQPVSFEQISADIEKLQIKRKGSYITGTPIVNPAYGLKETYEWILGVSHPNDWDGILGGIGYLYRTVQNESQIKSLEKSYIDIIDHMADQGMEAGGFVHNWYPGKGFAESTFLMKDVLEKYNRLDRAKEYLDYNYHTRDIFFDEEIYDPNMDFFYIDTRYLLYGAMLQGSITEQVRWLTRFKEHLSKNVLYEGPNGFKPDGSTFHHEYHNLNYALYCIAGFTRIIKAMSATPFALSPEAYRRLKKAALNQRYCANLQDLPLSLHGRYPFGHSQNRFPLNTETLFNLSHCGEPNSSQLDHECLAALLRLDPSYGTNAIFKKSGISAEKPPQGNLTMNFAAQMSHRRDSWLAFVRGYSKYSRWGESYASMNEFGRYYADGHLEILSGGNPVSLAESGCIEEGWDWNMLGGTTVIRLPAELLRSSGVTLFIRSPYTFIGGLTHNNQNGCFVMQLAAQDKYKGSAGFPERNEGKKTYFFFDDLIVCLGSGINNNDTEHPTVTTLFQKALVNMPASVLSTTNIGGEKKIIWDPSLPILVNGKTISVSTSNPVEVDNSGAGWIIDTQNTGYYFPAGSRVCYTRSCQTNRENTDKKILSGHFATAWINHGKAPSQAGYEYALKVKANEKEMSEFTAAMQKTGQEPYKILQKDSEAHIAYYTKRKLYAYILFSRQQLVTNKNMLVYEVSRPCLIMHEKLDNGGYLFSVCDPDLNIEITGTDQEISHSRSLFITLAGSWQYSKKSKEYRIISRTQASTIIEFIAHEGRSISVTLNPGVSGQTVHTHTLLPGTEANNVALFDLKTGEVTLDVEKSQPKIGDLPLSKIGGPCKLRFRKCNEEKTEIMMLRNSQPTDVELSGCWEVNPKDLHVETIMRNKNITMFEFMPESTGRLYTLSLNKRCKEINNNRIALYFNDSKWDGNTIDKLKKAGFIFNTYAENDKSIFISEEKLYFLDVDKKREPEAKLNFDALPSGCLEISVSVVSIDISGKIILYCGEEPLIKFHIDNIRGATVESREGNAELPQLKVRVPFYDIQLFWHFKDDYGEEIIYTLFCHGKKVLSGVNGIGRGVPDRLLIRAGWSALVNRGFVFKKIIIKPYQIPPLGSKN